MRRLSTIDILKVRSINVKDETKKNLRMTLDQIYNNEVGVNIKAKHFIDNMVNWPTEILIDRENEQTKD